MLKGAFGTWFSWQNTLQRAAPLLLTGLCTALPAQMGMVVIGAEGALVIGALAAMMIGLPLMHAGLAPLPTQAAMALAGMAAGAAWIGATGALRHWRGVSETISSLLLVYIGIALLNQMVEGPLRDPASLNKPSTEALADDYMIGAIPGTDIHWGLVFGLLACVGAYVLVYRTTFGFAMRMAGGNVRAA
ncbi:MAG: ABC transporter permease, partial [Alphaproteobacteria bacterium]|nr:ABC transporter permease [Alphaproteobacteria bacterium]